jgi:uncharacterized membrane protein HdeD (DUF308 family)
MAIHFKPGFVKPAIDRLIMAGACLVFIILALIAPKWPAIEFISYLGGMLAWVGVLEIYDSFRRPDRPSKNSALSSGVFSLLIASLMMGADDLKPEALFLMVVVIFGLDAVRYIWKFVKDFHRKKSLIIDLVAAFGSLMFIAILLLTEKHGNQWPLTIVICIRMGAVGYNLLIAKTGKLSEVDVDVLENIGLADDEKVRVIAEKVKISEQQSAESDRSWIVIFIVLLFVIHIGRMGFDRSLIHVLSPLLATLGDMIIALIITFVILLPLRLILLKVGRSGEQKLWQWVMSVDESQRSKIGLRSFIQSWLTYRMRVEIRFRKIGYSFLTALRTGLKFGLPWSALLVAIIPILGMSWYFDTENWA